MNLVAVHGHKHGLLAPGCHHTGVVSGLPLEPSLVKVEDALRALPERLAVHALSVQCLRACMHAVSTSSLPTSLLSPSSQLTFVQVASCHLFSPSASAAACLRASARPVGLRRERAWRFTKPRKYSSPGSTRLNETFMDLAMRAALVLTWRMVGGRPRLAMARTHSARAVSSLRPRTGSLPGRSWTLTPLIAAKVLKLRMRAVMPPAAKGSARDFQGTPASVLCVLIHRRASFTAAKTWDSSRRGFFRTYLRAIVQNGTPALQSELQDGHSKAASDDGGRLQERLH